MAPALSAPPSQASGHAEPTALPHVNGTAVGRQWPRDKWLEAIWNAPELLPNDRVVSYVFARYAGKKNVAWCKWDELVRRTGIKSRTTISKVIKKLVTMGWLRESKPAGQYFSARYELTIPTSGDGGQTSTSWTSERSRRTRAGRLRAREAQPDVQEVDVSDVQEVDPDIHLVDLSTQTEHSELQPGGTPPPDPLRTERPQAVTRTDHNDPLTAVPDLNDTKQVTSQTRTRGTTLSLHQLPMLSIIDGGIPDHQIDDYQLALPVTIPPPTPPDPERERTWAGMQSTIAALTRQPGAIAELKRDDATNFPDTIRQPGAAS